MAYFHNFKILRPSRLLQFFQLILASLGILLDLGDGVEHFSYLADEGFGFCDVRAHLDVVCRQRPRTKRAHFEILLTDPSRLAIFMTHFVRVVHDAGALAEGHSSIARHDLRH